MKRAVTILLALCMVSACASTSQGSGANARSGPLTTTVRGDAGFQQPSVQNIEGVSGLIGARAEGLTGHFGDARLDLSEGDARKLQFASDQCVLDIFLYPLEPGAAPTATYVEARSPNGGAKIDEARCIRELGAR